MLIKIVNIEESNIIDLNFSIEFPNNVSIITIIAFGLDQSDDSLHLVYPKLIDWEQKEPLDITTFPDDNAIVHYHCYVNPETSSTSEFNNEAYNQGSAKYLSHKMNKTNNRSNGENHAMAVLDHGKVKRKGISNGENLSKAPKDERLDTLPKHYKKISPILIKPIEARNIGTK